MADGSRANLKSNVKSFSRFCDLFGFVSIPAHPDTLVRYVAFSCVVEKLSIGTIRNHLSSIRRDHLVHGFNLPTPSECHPLSDVVRGSARLASKQVQKMWPIFPHLLSRLTAVTPFGSPLRCLFLLLFCTFCRLGSIIPTVGKQLFNVASHLVWGDISFSSSGVRLRVRKTKTIQNAERSLVFVVPFLANKSLCLGRTCFVGWCYLQ